MNEFLKVSAGVMVGLILWLCVSKQGKDISTLLTMAVCAMVFVAALAFLQPVIRFVDKLQSVGQLENELISVILKAVGIGVIGEICTMICKDAGNESLGKVLQLFASIVVVWMTLPVFERLLSLLDTILGTV